MSNFNFDDRLRRKTIGPVPAGVNGVFTLDAARADVCGRAVR